MIQLPRLAAAALLAANLLTACAAPPEQAEEVPDDTFAVRLICESQDIYRIYYSCYLDGAYYSMGGVADLDGKELTEEAPMTIYFPKSYFDGAEDISTFSMDFSPYGENDTSELATTARLSIPAAYGTCCTVVFSGDRETGFTAALQE